MATPKDTGGSVRLMHDVEEEAVGLIKNTLIRRGALPAKNLHGCVANGSIDARTFIGGGGQDAILEFTRKYPDHFKIKGTTRGVTGLF